MSSGRTLVFRYGLDGDRYSIQFHAGPEFSPDAQSDEGLQNLEDRQDHPALVYGHAPRLPEGVTFLSGETDADTRADSLGVEDQLPVGAELNWSEPILFYPDGTTSTARLVLKNEYDRCIDLSLRGLTGVVTVGKPYSAEGR